MQYKTSTDACPRSAVYASLLRVFEDSMVIHFIDNQGVLWNLVDASSRDPGCAGMAHSTALHQVRRSKE